MFRLLLAFGVLGCLHSVVQAQPSRCTENSQCVKGFYCDVDTFHCRECLSCEDHNREPSRTSSACITSVADCGACIKGLMEDHGGDGSPQCVAAIAHDDGGPPAYVWVAVAIGLLLLVLVVVIIVYVLRHTDTFKILASTRTSVQSPCSRTNGVSVASAPDLPPSYDATLSAPYNPQYRTAPASPSSPGVNEYTDTPSQDESARPFIKRAADEGEGGAAAREGAGRQAARVYYPPQYVRVPNLPASNKSPSVNEVSESTFTVHDEDTMESTWTPTPNADHTDNNGNAIASEPHTAPSPSGQLAAHSAHTSHALCTLQDSNNNRNEAHGAHGEGNSHAAPSFIINVVQNINAVQQHNDVTL